MRPEQRKRIVARFDSQKVGTTTKEGCSRSDFPIKDSRSGLCGEDPGSLRREEPADFESCFLGETSDDPRCGVRGKDARRDVCGKDLRSSALGGNPRGDVCLSIGASECGPFHWLHWKQFGTKQHLF